MIDYLLQERFKARNLPKETSDQRKKRRAANEKAAENLHATTILLQNGANAKYTTKGLTCLGQAAAVGNAEVVQILMQHGAELEGSAHQRRYKTCGYTPLMLAAQHGHVNVMRILLAAGTDLDASTAAVVKGIEETVWSVAEKHGTDEVKATLIEVVGEDSVRNSSGFKPTPPSSPRDSMTPRPPDSPTGSAQPQLSAKEKLHAKALSSRALSSSSHNNEMVQSVAQMVAMRKAAMQAIVEGGGDAVVHMNAGAAASGQSDQAAADGGAIGVKLPAIHSAIPAA